MKRSALAMPAIFGILLATLGVARADTIRCRGEFGGRTISGNLVVPDGAVRTLRDSVVTGDVLVGHEAALRLLDGVAVRGNLRIDHCDYTSFEPLTPAAPIAIAGNVEIEHCAEASGKVSSAGRVTIGGNFVCHDNSAPCYAVSLTIGGDARIDRNSGGPSFIESNIIAGDLRCAGNSGVTDYGSPNIVAGKKLDECAGLSK
jgi:hypothetical protein